MQDPDNTPDALEFTRACARSADVVVVGAVLTSSEIYQPETRLFRFEHDAEPGKQWYFDDFDFHMQDCTLFRNPDVDANTDYLTYLSSEGDVFHAWWKGNFREKIAGAGTWVGDAKGFGRLSAIAAIEDVLYACGQGGQFYRREGRDDWQLVTDALLFDMQSDLKLKENAPKTDDPAFLSWLMDHQKNAPRKISFNALQGQTEESIYLCGEEGTRPVLCFWDGKTLEELDVPLQSAALTGIYIENDQSVWVSGREGVILHGSAARGFTQVQLREQLNLFHMITPYRGKLVLPSSVRPGGLFEYDPATGDFQRFTPPLPKLRGDYIFHAEAVGEILWVVGQKDIFRFDGATWEQIEHPDM